MIGGVAVTGIYAASLSIVALINPFLVGMFNIMTPKAVRALQADGIAGLRKLTARYTIITALTVIPFAGFIAVAGDRVMGMIYPDPAYAGNGHILTLLALSAAVASLGGPATIALSVAELGKAIAGVALATFVGGILFITPMMMAYGITGAVIGVLTTELFGTALRWFLVVKLLATDHSSKAFPDVEAVGAITGIKN
jgi:O-antigen/teichoic acid export membrane protein